jgi:hypothetical protein
MKCKCHPDSPFLWAKTPRDSMFVKDIAFRPKTPQTYAHLTPEQNIVLYKQFSIYSRANPMIKPTLNKHQLPKGKA